MGDNKLTIPYPPNEVFSHRNVADTMMAEGNRTHLLDTSKPHPIEYPESGGILVHIVDAKYPKKGFPFPEGVWSINLAKKFFVALLKILTLPQMLGWTTALVLPYKVKIRLMEQILDNYTRLAHGAIRPFLLKEHYLTPAAKELGRSSKSFMVNLGLSEFIADQTSQVISAVIEYDDAYRYRLEDIMLETTIEKLSKNPSKELKRLFNIMRERDQVGDVKEKAKKIEFLITLLFLSRKVKKAFRKTLLTTNLVALQADDADKYWMSMRSDYDYFGTKFEERDVTLLKSFQISI